MTDRGRDAEGAPRVSVIMRVYNAGPFLAAAVQSVLGQSYGDLELVAVDDASTDGSDAVLRSFSDPRLRVIRNDRNLGPAKTANRCLAEARGEYIANLDADDLCFRERLARQARFMDTHPDLGISGAWARPIGAGRGVMRNAVSPREVHCQLLFDSAFVHSSVIMRREQIVRHGLKYSDLSSAQDYEFFQRAADCFPMANLPETLVSYRIHAASITGSQSGKTARMENLKKIDRAALARLGIEATDEELVLHNALRHGTPQALDAAEKWLSRILEANRKIGRYPSPEFEQAVAKRWFTACNVARGWGLAKWPPMRSSPLAHKLRATPFESLKFLARVRL